MGVSVFLAEAEPVMETMSASSYGLNGPPKSSHYDEICMQQSLIFSDSLKELKNLRSQLYSAAEYFELSYNNDDQKEIVVDTLRDYAVRALVNTVDHLGSVTCKVTDMMDERVNVVSGAELRVTCIEQRLKTCQSYIDHEGLSQQSLSIATPKHHKRYILPGKYIYPFGETMRACGPTISAHQWCSLDDEDQWHQFKNAVRSTIIDTSTPSVRKERSRSASPQRPSQHESPQRPSRHESPHRPSRPESPHRPSRSVTPQRSSRSGTPQRSSRSGTQQSSSRSGTPQRSSRSSTPQRSARPGIGVFCFTEQSISEKRTISPGRPRYPLARSGSLQSRTTTPISSRSTTPVPNRPTTPSDPITKHRSSFDSWKSASMRVSSERNIPKEVERAPSRSKRLLKALLSRRKSAKDEALYTFLDEY
ncbi:hypothetical protein C5167_047494 [Papaver somniferum]|uniref:Protein ABIL3 n=1 Tax=Papaver somniferum TaxID=3469 RepID=A0A4Y7LJQ7_PAPSO|nr:hypothetical protein C5167_047494 [Papaver somniferum]